MTQLKSNFDLVFNTPECVLIRDNANITITMTVTNDAENVVKFLKENAILFHDTKLYSICTDGTIDELLHDGNGKFTGFKFAFADEDAFFNSFNK